MNKSVLMIMGGALLVAIVVAMLVQAKLRPSKKDVDVSNQILVTNKQIFTGEKLKPEDVHWESWASGGMFKGTYKHDDYPDDAHPPEGVYDTPLRRTLEAGEPVTSQALIPDIKGGNNFLAATIDPGMRAVGLRVNDVTSVGGFVAPGDHVDIVLSYPTTLPGAMAEAGQAMFGRYAAQTVLSDIKVLAVDQSFKDENREAKISKVVTLEVTRQQAEILALVAQMGELSLTLRRIGEKDTAESLATPFTSEARTSELYHRLRQTGSTGTVRVYNGTNISNMPVRQDSN